MTAIRRIGTCSIRKGKTSHGYIHVRNGPSIPVAVMKGSVGKTCFIMGGLHGDEINGPGVVHHLMNELKPSEVKGTIIFLPVVNVSGFMHKQRTVYEDDRDLNRVFPGTGKTLSFRIAGKVFSEVMKKSDFGIDCHDAGKNDALLPHPRVHVNRKGVSNDGCTVETGRLLGTRLILQRWGIKGMAGIEAFRQLKIPVLTVEVGGGLHLWKGLIEKAARGIENVLRYHGVLKGPIRLPRHQFLISDINRHSYTCKISGLLYKKVSLGEYVHKGDLLAMIENPINQKREKFHSRECGFIFSIRTADKVDPDDVILTILQTKHCRKHSTKPHPKAVRLSN